MNVLRACLDWRVITGIAALGIGVYVVNPTLLAGVFPLLLVAVCPLSMMVMMRAMAGRQTQPNASEPAARADQLRVRLAGAIHEQQRLTRELETVEASSTPAVVPESATASRLAVTPGTSASTEVKRF